MYLSVVRIYPPRGREQAVIDVLDSLKGSLANNVDCLGYLVTLEPRDGGAVCYTEQWRTRNALDQHLCSHLFGRVLEAIECSHQPPEVVFYKVADVGGLELVEQVRTNHRGRYEALSKRQTA